MLICQNEGGVGGRGGGRREGVGGEGVGVGGPTEALGNAQCGGGRPQDQIWSEAALNPME